MTDSTRTLPSERALVRALARRFRRGAALPRGAIGIGDDAAVLPPTRFPRVYTVDCSVEGVHFKRSWLQLEDAASRAVTAAVSDLAAMGASVREGGLLSALTLPPTLTEREFHAVIAGIARAARRYGLPVLGGNLSAAPVLSFTTTVLGTIRSSQRKVGLRSGARPGDRLVVSGPLGDAAFGRTLLERQVSFRGNRVLERAVRAWRSPRAALEEGARLARCATAMIDVSDGLAKDAEHLAEASGCRLVVEASALAGEGTTRGKEAAKHGLSLVELSLYGGEDYVLVATVPAGRALPKGTAVIGYATKGAGVWLAQGDGLQRVRGGFEHFR